MLALTLVFPAIVRAQSEQPTPTPADPLTGVPVQVLDQQQVQIGTHVITYNRIVPPVFPAATPVPVASPTPQATPTVNAVTQSKRRTQRATRSATTRSKAARSTRDASSNTGNAGDVPFSLLNVSATVYDHQFTEVRWYGNGGTPDLRVYVNMDFNYLTTIGTLQTANASYELVMGLGNETADSLIQAGEQPPNLASFSTGYSSYQVITGNPADHASDLAALNAFLAYYDANSAQLFSTYQQQQAANAAQQAWLQAHPPVQPNTVINYWPVKSQVYLAPSH